MLLLKFLWGVTAVLRSEEITRDLQQAAKRFSDVVVGLCRSLNCDAQLPQAPVAYTDLWPVVGCPLQ